MKEFLSRQGLKLSRHLRAMVGRDVSYSINGLAVRLPPSHLLPLYQKRNPRYDTYFLAFFSSIYREGRPFQVVDIGANVGDTALAVLSVAPDARILCVEGSPSFIPYLLANTAPYEEVQVLQSFVTTGYGTWIALDDGSTGHLALVNHDSPPSESDFITAEDLLSLLNPGGITIWKTDTDGFDIAIVAAAFDQIVEHCEVIWMEFDPVGILTQQSDLSLLFSKLAQSSLDVVIFDNLGNRMMHVSSDVALPTLENLTQWLQLQASAGNRTTPYLDVWLLPPHRAKQLVLATIT